MKYLRFGFYIILAGGLGYFYTRLGREFSDGVIIYMLLAILIEVMWNND